MGIVLEVKALLTRRTHLLNSETEHFPVLRFPLYANIFTIVGMKYLLCVLVAAGLFSSARASAELSDADLARIGHKVWINECAGTISGLTSWNEGEDFASLGIGHFIWYPAGKRGPFEESFPPLVEFLAAHGENVPAWMRGPCPWQTRTDFMAAQHGERLEALRNLLAATVPLQTRFIARRMHEALPKMLAAASPAEAAKVRHNFQRLEASGAGTFALIDYVNFKGEGTLATERYNGQGWGLLQVLEAMPETGDAPRAFSQAAKATLAHRVRNSPPERHEARWLPGWDARVDRYAE
jgi:hypothetical protein